MSQNPFDLNNPESYTAWRAAKLEDYPRDAGQIMVRIAQLAAPTETEQAAILRHCAKTNMALYHCTDGNGDDDGGRTVLCENAGAFAASFGLHRVEAHRSAESSGVVALEVTDKGGKKGFIPYTDKPLSWHTDGYYNKPTERIRAMYMHSRRPAKAGGENAFLDPEIAYIRVRDENPAYLKALCHRRAMTIPSYTDETSGATRPESTGPVFSVDRYTGNLHMRFTDRKRNIVWRDTPDTLEALAFLRQIFDTDPLILRHRLEAGQGIVCNNVLHNRSRFDDDPRPGRGRLMLRARYLDRVLDPAAENRPLAPKYDSGVWQRR